MQAKSTYKRSWINYKNLRVAAISLGCSKNRIDTEEILGYLTGRGAIITDDFASAHIVIVNTCGFIEEAQQEAINTLVEVGAMLKGTGTKLVAAGCLVEVYGGQTIAAVPEIDGAIWGAQLQGSRSFLCKPFERQQGRDQTFART